MHPESGTMAAAGGVANDTRGWILCLISATACVFGACIVCVDVVVRRLPGMKSFRIQDSSTFLSASLSLSFGVMIFSALFSMLPSAKRYLAKDGHSDQVAGLLMVAGLAVGFVGMQIVSRVIHRFMPSHVVDCDHSHDGGAAAHHGHHEHHEHHEHHGRAHHLHPHGPGHGPHVHVFGPPAYVRQQQRAGHGQTGTATESTPLLAAAGTDGGLQRQLSSQSDGAPIAAAATAEAAPRPPRSLASLRRPSMVEVRNRVLSFVKDVKANCDEFGPCYGYTDLCGQECKRNPLVGGPGAGAAAGAGAVLRHPDWESMATVPVVPEEGRSSSGSEADEEGGRGRQGSRSVSPRGSHNHHHPQDHEGMRRGDPQTASCPPSAAESAAGDSSSTTVVSSQLAGAGASRRHGRAVESDSDGDDDGDVDEAGDLEAGTRGGGHASQQHHHHVPANAFLSIGVQTVVAIGLHKFPEGFIAFATNHASPALGFSVFLALFVHNIAEGFALALPLYMALGSRLRAILWAAALGGLSQPLGAGAAALWLAYIGRDGGGGGGGASTGTGTAYGLLFAATAGIMVAVALQLFVESLALQHNRQLCVGFAFVGMLLLALSSALGPH